MRSIRPKTENKDLSMKSAKDEVSDRSESTEKNRSHRNTERSRSRDTGFRTMNQSEKASSEVRRPVQAIKYSTVEFYPLNEKQLSA